MSLFDNYYVVYHTYLFCPFYYRVFISIDITIDSCFSIPLYFDYIGTGVGSRPLTITIFSRKREGVHPPPPSG
jgi:hypothetical protein